MKYPHIVLSDVAPRGIEARRDWCRHMNWCAAFYGRRRPPAVNRLTADCGGATASVFLPLFCDPGHATADFFAGTPVNARGMPARHPAPGPWGCAAPMRWR
jgi:hypothetical protein